MEKENASSIGFSVTLPGATLSMRLLASTGMEQAVRLRMIAVSRRKEMMILLFFILKQLLSIYNTHEAGKKFQNRMNFVCAIRKGRWLGGGFGGLDIIAASTKEQ